MNRRTAVGIDLGSVDVFAANVGRKGVDVVQNAVSERRTPALVSFTERRRLVGDAAFAQVRSNYRNSCRGIKHLVGRAWDSPELDAERLWSLCPLGKATDGDVGFEVSYRGHKQCFSATVALSMLIAKIVVTCEAWTKMQVRDVVLAIPSYFTDRHRQACLDAMRIAGITCLRLIHESTAIALAWRFERCSFDDSKPITVAFCSCGHSCLFVAIARFEQKAVEIIGEAVDRSVSGRAMDWNIMEIFRDSLKKQGAPDALASMKSQLKLEEAATKVKKTLSVVDEARGTAECVVEDYDLSCNVTRGQFEELCAPLAEKAKGVVERALASANLQPSDVNFVEVVGGVSRVPWVQRVLREGFGGRELSTTLNADEAVARGCAWQAAMLSTFVRLDQIPMREFGHLAIALEWDDSPTVEAEGSEALEGGRRRLMVFDACAGPGVKAEVGLRCKGTLALTAVYVSDEALEPGVQAVLGSWTFAVPNREMQDVEIKCCLDLNGVFSITDADVCSSKEAAAAAKEKEAEAEEARAAKARAAEEKAAEEKAAEAKAAEAKAVEEEKREEDEVKTPARDDAPPVAPDGPAADAPQQSEEPEEIEFGDHMHSSSDSKRSWLPTWRFWRWGRGAGNADSNGVGTPRWEEQPKKVGAKGKRRASKAKRTPVSVTVVSRPGYSSPALEAAVQSEKKYRAADEAIVEAENRRNDYEALIFDLRGRIGSGEEIFAEYASPEELSALKGELETEEEWLYEHGEEEAAVYSERLEALKSKVDEFSRRKQDLEWLHVKAKALKASVRKYKALATAPKFDHIAKEKLSSVIEECDGHTQWIEDIESNLANQKKWEPSGSINAELMVRNSTLSSNATKIFSEPRPQPPKKEKATTSDVDAKGASSEPHAGEGMAAAPAAANAKTAAAKARGRGKSGARRWKRRIFTFVGIFVATAILGLAYLRYGELGDKTPQVLLPLAQFVRADLDLQDEEAALEAQVETTGDFDEGRSFSSDEM